MTRRHQPATIRLAACLALALCATGAIGAATSQPAAASSLLDNLPRALGRTHPMLVHFPIALLIAGVLFEFVAIVIRRDRTKPSVAGLACVAVGALGAGAAAWAGWLNADLETHGRGVADLMETHRWLGIVAASLAGVALIGGLIGMTGKARAMTAVYRIALVLAAGTVGAAGHWGGSMVYGEGYLTEALFPAPAPEAPSAEAQLAELAELEASGTILTVDFATQIMPILEASCIECHGPNKKKGNLRLDTRMYAMDARDADEQVFIPGDAENSEVFWRVTLPHDDPDLMPPEGDGDPLTAEQIALLETWINEGAVWVDVPMAVAAETTNQAATEDASPALPPFVFDDAARAQQAAGLDALRQRGAVANRLASDEPWVEVRLDLLGQSVTDADLDLLEPLAPTLASLHLAGTAVTDEGVARLAAFPRLERLHLERTAVTDEGVAHLAGLTQLRYLNLYGTGVTDAALVTIADLPSIESVYLWQTGVSPQAGALLAALMPGVVVDLGLAAEPAVFPEAEAAAEPEAAESESDREGDVAADDPAEARIDLASLPGCCRAAAEKGNECDHPCCVEARAKGEICATCAGN
ncbi:MAG: c-type cytochrome domain-containing protein [Phycisphaerales bacterium JB041]